MKNILKYISLGILVFLGACGKELDLQPKQSVDAKQALSDPKLYLVGAYAVLGSGGPLDYEGGFYATDVLMCADLLASTDYVNWQGTFTNYREISRNNMVSNNSIARRVWRKGYLAINMCNMVLENLSNVSSKDRATVKGEASFIRGIALFELVRLYGEPFDSSAYTTALGVPILLNAVYVEGDIKKPQRATLEACYKQILADLDSAEALLPESNDVFATSLAAKAFKAKVYLQLGAMDKALAYADEVVQNGAFSLVSNPLNNFNGNSESEYIFSIQQTTQNNAGTANDGLTTFYGCDAAIQGGAGRGDISIEDAFVSLYDSTDLRKTALIYDGDCGKSGPFTGKWKNPYTNIPVVRLSEMYLIRAEANQKLGSAVGASPLDDLNAIRSRSNAFTLTDVTLSDIYKERELELCFEGARIHDIKRLKSSTGTYDWNDPKLVFPIPLDDINTNPNLKQNKGY